MSNFELPRRGSSPHLVLTALNNVGGEASIETLMKVRNWNGRLPKFRDDILQHLVRCDLIELSGNWCVITNTGRKYLGIKVEEQGYIGIPAAPRIVQKDRPLNLSRHFPPRPLRPGADDFRSVPSVMGGQRVAYR
jgi:hypothetical protein